MMARTTIEWVARPGTAPESWSPVTGCSKLSEGCRHCYAERMARRLAGRYGYPEIPHHFDVTLHPDRLEQPLHWTRKPRTVFVASMGDLFHPDVPFEFVEQVFGVFTKTKQHTYMILTKRPKRMLEWWHWEEDRQCSHIDASWFPNVWGMVTVESQDYVWRIEELLKCPFAIHGVSVEPMLGPVNLNKFLPIRLPDGKLIFSNREDIKPFINWVIAGGESGPGARPMHPGWARDLRDQCFAAHVPFFLKQRGAWTWWDLGSPTYQNKPEHIFSDGLVVRRVGKKAAGRLLDGREWNEFFG